MRTLITSSGFQRLAGKVAAALWLAIMLAGWSGCALWRGSESGDGESLESALAGMALPLPFDDGGKAGRSYSEGRDAARSDEAALLAGADLSHFTEAGDPLLRAGLTLLFSLRVGEKQEVATTPVIVDDQGEISLPMIGLIECEGLTLAQLKRILHEKYGAYYREPEVTLNFRYEEGSVSPWGRVLVQGRVAREGWVNIPPTRDLTVSRAIQVAGGYSSSAKKSDIVVHRRKLDGSQHKIQVDLERVGKRGEVERDIALQPGDVVFVPESMY